MTINTGINPALLRPQTFHNITYLQGGRSLIPVQQRLCLVGMQSSVATAVAGVIIPLDDPGETDALFGVGSYMALMARKAFDTMNALGQGPALYACPLAQTTTKRQETITITGTATADGNLIIRIAGRYINIGVASGTVQNNIAAALNTAIVAIKLNLPVLAAVATNVVTCTDVCQSVLGVDVVYSLVSAPAGVTVAFAQTVAGAGVLDMQPALDAIIAQDFDGIAVCNHQTADITEISTQITSTWTPSEKKPRWFFVGEPGSIATATTLASAANHEGVVIVNMEQSPSLPCEIATAAAVGALSKSRPNANYDGMVLPLYPPPIAFNFTNGELETALNAGITPLGSIVDTNTRQVIDGVVYVVRLITSRTTVLINGVSTPYGLTRDFGISRTAWALARQYDLRYAIQFGSQANPDGVLDDADTIDRIRDMVIGVNFEAQSANWIKDYDTDKAALIVEDDPVASGRVNVDNTYTIVVGLHQVAFVSRAQVG